jgi:6-pyruvoyl-tetrahydropterin synthase
MTTITVDHTISLGHRLPSYDGICSSPHGHNARFEVTLEVFRFVDFKKVKDALLRVIGDMDHAMILHAADPLVEVLKPFNFRLFILTQEPTTENLAQYVFNTLSLDFCAGPDPAARIRSATVYETDKYSATVTSSRFGIDRR